MSVVSPGDRPHSHSDPAKTPWLKVLSPDPQISPGVPNTLYLQRKGKQHILSGTHISKNKKTRGPCGRPAAGAQGRLCPRKVWAWGPRDQGLKHTSPTWAIYLTSRSFCFLICCLRKAADVRTKRTYTPAQFSDVYKPVLVK